MASSAKRIKLPPHAEMLTRQALLLIGRSGARAAAAAVASVAEDAAVIVKEADRRLGKFLGGLAKIAKQDNDDSHSQ